ncbi:MAG: acylphosphatase [Candidatus Omnitrophota bacterium]|nr:acylphosphatase [Candidatus Omnitrophota bacterium]
MKKQLHIYISGQVQGVGFRYTAREIADETGICGWVANLRDGRVEIVAEAEEDALKSFLVKINTQFSRYIQDTQSQWLAASGEYKDFEIRFE